MTDLPPDVQLGLDIYLAFLQRGLVVGEQMQEIGGRLIAMTEKFVAVAESNPNFDYDKASKALSPVSKLAEAYAMHTSFVSDWIVKIHAIQ